MGDAKVSLRQGIARFFYKRTAGRDDLFAHAAAAMMNRTQPKARAMIEAESLKETIESLRARIMAIRDSL